MLAKIRAGALLRQRSWRLLVPLMFGMLVIVPPQPYFRSDRKSWPTRAATRDFMRLYVSGYQRFLPRRRTA